MKFLLNLFVVLLLIAPIFSFAQGVQSPEIGAGTYDETGNNRVNTFGSVDSTERTGANQSNASGGLVPCSGPDCNSCSVIQLVNNVISFLVTILSAIAVIIIVVAGFKMVTAGGNPAAWEDAKKMFGSVVIGIIIVLAAWLIIDTLLGMLTIQGGLEFWGSVSCSAAGSLSAVSTNSQSTANQNQVTASGNLVSYSGAQFDSSIIDKVEYLDNNFALTVSGGYRTAARNAEVNGASNSHHLTGRAADFVGSQSAMSEGAAWARANGAREVLIHNAGSGTHLHVAW